MPTDLDISAPCVVFALRRESMHFRRAYRFQQRFPGAPCCAQFRGSVLLEKRGRDSFAPKTSPDPFFRRVLMLESGIGAAAMETALRWCLNEPRFGGVPYRPRFVLCAGFSGALQSEQRVGDVVVATEIVDQQGNRWPALCPSSLAGRDIVAGRLLTVSELVSDPREKERLGRQYQALAVDMESAAPARLCQEHDVPFACLRVISDDWQTALSAHLVDLLGQGRVSIPRLAAKVLRYPALIGELRRLAAQTRQASMRLLEPLEWLISDRRSAGLLRD